MIRVSTALCWAVLSLTFCLLSGCAPAGDVQVDEQKDPHFQRGRALVLSQDFPAAMEEFEKALEANPRSASAHFQLGWLCEEKTKDYAEAIYHYRKHLALQPNSDDAPKAQDRVKFCLTELAKAEYSQPNTQNLQREIDRLTAENVKLNQQVQSMTTQLVASASSLAAAQRAVLNAENQRAAAVEALEAAKAAAASRSNWRESSISPSGSSPYGNSSSFSGAAGASSSTARPRTHIVRPRETIAGIAKKYGIRQSTLLSANPKVNPNKLKAGQTLRIP